jgi:hypothetical protein
MAYPLKVSSAVPTVGASPLAQMRRGDPLIRLLARWHIKPFGVIVMVAGYGLLHALALPALFGHLRTAGGVAGILDDPPSLIIILLLLPLVLGYYAWQPAIIQTLYEGISARASHNPTAGPRAAALLRPLGWRVWSVVGVTAGLLECGLWVADIGGLPQLSWENVNWVMIASLLVLRFITFYALVFMLVRQLTVLFGLNQFFIEFSVEIQPLHPDRAGGLRVLGDYVLTNGLVVAVVGLILGMELLRVRSGLSVATPEFYGELAIYFLAAPTVFFLLPLYSAHKRMVEAKQKLLAEIAEQFDLEYRVLLDGLRQDVLKLEEVERLEAIQKIYEITQSSPDWPFNLALISQFGVAVLLPVLLPLGVELIGSRLTK